MADRKNRLGIEVITALGLAPVEFVRAAASAGCRRIGIAPEPVVLFDGYPRWSLRDDAALLRDTKAALTDEGVAIMLGEGFLGLPHRDMREAEGDLDLLAELGAPIVNMVSVDGDRGRAIDQCALFAELATGRGLVATLEFMPGLPVTPDLPSAREVVRQTGNPGFRLMLDAMHVFRSGGTVEDIAALSPGEIGHVQICDVPRAPTQESYADEARYNRLLPGEGELPLQEFIAAIPDSVGIGLEIPMLAKTRAGTSPVELFGDCLRAARALLN